MPGRKTAAKSAASKEKKVYIVHRNIHHDGEPYTTGDEIELTVGEAEALFEVGALKPLTLVVVPVPATEPTE